MFEIASIKKIYYRKQGLDGQQGGEYYVLADLFFRNKTFKSIKLYQSLGFQMRPIVNELCLVILDEQNINEGQIIAFYMGGVEKLKLFINNVNVLEELSKFIQIEIETIDLIKASNSANISALNAQILINTQIASSVPTVAAVINAQNPNITNAINTLTAQNTNLDSKKTLLQSTKDNIDKTFFLEYE